MKGGLGLLKAALGTSLIGRPRINPVPCIDISKVKHGRTDWNRYFERRIRRQIGKYTRQGISSERALIYLGILPSSRERLYSNEYSSSIKKIKDNNHVCYTEKDFTIDEITRKNSLAVAVLDNGKFICKQCGKEGNDLLINRCR